MGSLNRTFGLAKRLDFLEGKVQLLFQYQPENTGVHWTPNPIKNTEVGPSKC
jgi:hypothetical protein